MVARIKAEKEAVAPIVTKHTLRGRREDMSDIVEVMACM
jgi:hypothetical protein